MQLDWTTILLEIVNFLVLVWLLKRFLYRPVLDIIARRKAQIEQTLNDAHATEQSANALKQTYEQRLGDWEHEREAARAGLREELAAERERRLRQLEQTLADEREKDRARGQRQAEQAQRLAQAQAVEMGAAFASRLLERLSGPELDARLIGIAIEDFDEMPESQRTALRVSAREPGAALQLTFAREAAPAEVQRLIDALHRILEAEPTASVAVAPELISGLLISLGPWVMKANLRDELGFFREGAQSA
jgi:F-type H+-transporting ATPase subunit b